MLISKLIVLKISETMHNCGTLESLSNRCTGDTTARAMIIVGECMQNGTVVFHNGESNELLQTVLEIIKKLKLQHINVETGRINTTLKYNIYLSENELHAAIFNAG